MYAAFYDMIQMEGLKMTSESSKHVAQIYNKKLMCLTYVVLYIYIYFVLILLELINILLHVATFFGRLWGGI